MNDEGSVASRLSKLRDDNPTLFRAVLYHFMPPAYTMDRPRSNPNVAGRNEVDEEALKGQTSDEETDSNEETQVIRTLLNSKKKRKAGERVEWSTDDDNDPYEEFKNRKSIKRKKINQTKKRLATQAKNSRKDAKNGGKTSDKEKDWSNVTPNYEALEDSIPEYFKSRRKDFDEKVQLLKRAGLKLPPSYDDIDFSDDDRLAELKERPDFSASIETSRPYKDVPLPHSAGTIPASISQYLRDYQIDGIAFLHELFVYQKGGILGDDMGLGKTVQVAAFLTVAFGKTGDERDAKRMRKMRRASHKPWYPRILIICPASLLENWKTELERWGWWHVDKYHGDSKSKDDVLQAISSGRLEIIVTTYHTYRDQRSLLNLIEWDCIVADECHMFKGRTSAIAEAMNEVNALCRIGLTGTAIQNKYEELWTLLNWTNPGRLGPSSTWNSCICEPMKIGQSHNATLRQLRDARTTATKLVQNLLPQFFLRRMKSLIAHQLPKKTDTVVFCPLTEIQKSAYQRFLDCDWVQTVKTSSNPCDCGSEKSSGACCHIYVHGTKTKWKAIVFPIIITLQKLSNHLALLIPNSSDSVEKQERDLGFFKQMVPELWRDLYATRDSLQHLSKPEFCGKWKVLKKLLKFWHNNGDKVLIFSHSVRLLKMLELLFKNTSYNVSFLSGSMPNEDRQTTVDDFNSDPHQFVFLISTKAGGVGLNITSANKVVIFDPNWNPSYDLQAQDRAYRIGQLRDVEVFRLVSAGTIEEIVYARQIYKQQQANIGYTASTERRYFTGIQNATQHRGELFGMGNLLSFHGNGLVLRDIVNKTNVAEAKVGVTMVGMDMDEVLNDEDNPLRVEDDEQGDGAMSQLAALLMNETGHGSKARTDSGRPKTDAIQAILASAGVEYTHDNSEVIGSSKVEAQLSRRAEEIGNEVQAGEERLFMDGSQPRGSTHHEYHPPESVMLRQFCTMARDFGFASATEFALVVEGWTQKQRTNCLDRFYLQRKERLNVLAEDAAETRAVERRERLEAAEAAANPAPEVTGEDRIETVGAADDAETESASASESDGPLDRCASPVAQPHSDTRNEDGDDAPRSAVHASHDDHRFSGDWEL